MAKVIIKNDNQVIELPDGSSLAELDGKTNILFACKTGSCGSCLVTVLRGMENLSPIEETEKVGLETFGTGENQRLLCQTKILKGEVEIEY